jgi:hypothetical protein
MNDQEIADFVALLTEEQTKTLAAALIAQLDVLDLAKICRDTLDDDDQAELAAQLED